MQSELELLQATIGEMRDDGAKLLRNTETHLSEICELKQQLDKRRKEADELQSSLTMDEQELVAVRQQLSERLREFIKLQAGLADVKILRQGSSLPPPP